MITNNVIHIYQNYIIGKDFKFEISTNILKNGVILNKEKFIKTYMSLLKKNNICKCFFLKSIQIIYDELLSYNEKQMLKNTFELIYYKVELKSEQSFINLTKKDCYLLLSNTLKLYYIDSYNKKVILSLDVDNLKSLEIKNIIKNRVKNNLYLINIDEDFKNKIIDKNINYYFAYKNDEFFLKNEI